ncbi:histone-lysine N-methyltransferase, H3 lysine-79 specific-like [Rhopilema esculentum]|uniref:histone-lysine N-methyltransferase, H3 lysine-79 specific-like n=1 Tax=Rhopilema esculentum TaxID=499914 RepID=UPI0031DE9E4D
MIWTEEHNIMLCREVLVVEPYKFKLGSRERGHCWDTVAKNLNGLAHPSFMVDKRAVRDHFLKLIRDFERKMAKEQRASGIATEMSELDEAVETIIGRMERAEEEIVQTDRKRSKEVEREREAAENIRKRAMETVRESRGRDVSEGGVKKKRMENKLEWKAMDYLKGRHDEEVDIKKLELELKERELRFRETAHQQNYELKKQELELKEREGEDRRKKIECIVERETKLMNLLQQQQLLFNQISQQNLHILDLLKKLTEK